MTERTLDETIALRRLVAEKEWAGTLVEWVKENHPEMILPDGSVAKFQLADKLEIW